jgi:hypothetical protein
MSTLQSRRLEQSRSRGLRLEHSLRSKTTSPIALAVFSHSLVFVRARQATRSHPAEGREPRSAVI